MDRNRPPHKKRSRDSISFVPDTPTHLTHDQSKTMPTAVANASRFRHENNLEKDILATGPLRTKSKKRKTQREEDDDLGYVDAKSSRKILKIGQELQNEDAEAQSTKPPLQDPFAFETRFPDGQEEQDFEKYDDDDEEGWGDEEDEIIEEAVRETETFTSSLLFAERYPGNRSS